LPTVTTTIFKAFPCDPLDNGETMLRADYSLSCEGGLHKAMQGYAVAMVLVFPIGIPFLYAWLLVRNKAGIKRDEEEREEDEELMTKAFLFDAYQPR
jgi:hypothetical protein